MLVQDLKRSLRAVLATCLAVFALGLSGCASTIDSEFIVYHAWPTDAAQRTYRFVAPPQRDDSLEQAAFHDLARPELARAGFVESPAGRFGVTLDFSIDRIVRPVAFEPFPMRPWLAWGGWPGDWYGWGIGATIPLGWPSVHHQTVQRSTLALHIDDLSVTPARRVYETTAVSEDLESDATRVLPVMLRQVLSEFPGPAGVARRATTTLP